MKMLTLEDAAMMESGKKASQFRMVSHSKKHKKVKDAVATEGEINHTFIYPMRILLTADDPPGMKCMQTATYNPIPKTKTKTLMLMMTDTDPGLTITSIDGIFPKTKDTFKKYFT